MFASRIVWPLRHARMVGNGCRWNAAMISTTTMMPTDRQIMYWNASAPAALRLAIAPKLHTTPAPRAVSDATTGSLCRSVPPCSFTSHRVLSRRGTVAVQMFRERARNQRV